MLLPSLKHSVACIVGLYTTHMAMSAEKTVAVSFRVSPHVKRLLETAAARERRSQTTMLEMLLFDFCEHHGIELPEQQKPIARSKKGGTKK